ncbi:MAG TPA: methyltransferase domain-containing protein [Microthrixaceae bacterium]|nr:methyltransferase domain-containing protein [Microthrixaceae bacterium]
MTPDEAVRRLAVAGCVDPVAEVQELARWAPQGFGGWSVPADWVRRRSLGTPLAWVTGHACLGGLDVRVAPGVYPPRPWSAELALIAASHLAGFPLSGGGRMLDLCTGCGAVAALVAQRRPTAFVVGVDLDPAAAACARSNGVIAVIGDLDSSLDPAARFDVVTAVAPYVPTAALTNAGGVVPDVAAFEPVVALDGGVDGLEVLRRVVRVAAQRLASDGWLVVEVGGEQDRELVPALAAAGFSEVTPWYDADGDLLGIAARRQR